MNQFTLNKTNLAYYGPAKMGSYHNHTSLSDGIATAAVMAKAGKAAGLREMGISDHCAIPPGEEPPEWSISLASVGEYVEMLQKLKQEMDDENFTLRIGLEVDFFFENTPDLVRDLRKYPLDYLIGAVHYSGSFPIDHEAYEWEELTPEQRDEVCEIYWKKMEGAAASGLFDFIAHPDLPKKFAMIDSGKYLPHAVRFLEAARKSGTPIEINTAGWFKPCAEQYPSFDIIQEAAKRHIPVFISADAHDPAHVTRNFDQAAELLLKAGYSC